MSTDSYSVDSLFQRLYHQSKIGTPTRQKQRSSPKPKPKRSSRAESSSQQHSSHSSSSTSFTLANHQPPDKLNEVLAQIRSEIQKAVQQSGLHAVQSRFDSSDVVQDSMLQIWNQLQNADMQQLEFTRGLLTVIAKGHTAKNIRRHTAQKRSVANEVKSDLSAAHTSKEPTALDNAEVREQIGLLIEAMGLLHPARQMIVFRRFFDGASYQEIGAEMNRTKEWARKHCLKAQRDLRIILMH